MNYLEGLVAAGISALGWGSYFVPMKRVKNYDSFYFQLLMCIAIFASSFIVSIFTGSLVFSMFGILSGFLWALGNILAVMAVKHGGLSKTAPVWMGSGIFVSMLWGTLFFHEKVSILLSSVGILFIIIGVVLISSLGSGKVEKSVGHFRGIIFALIAGLLFGSYLIPFQLSGLEPLVFLFPMALGILIGGVLIYIKQKSLIDKSIVGPGLLTGVIWNAANISSFFAVKNLGVTIGFPLTQLALFVSVLWGALFFREVRGKNNLIKLGVSSIILFVGAIFLAFSK